MPLLNIIWYEIAQKPKRALDDILRGPPDIKQYEKPDSGSLDQAFQLQKLISERIVNMHVDIQKIIKQDTNPATSGKEDQALRLEKLISEHIAKMHVETQNVIKVPAETTLKHPNVPSTGKVIRTYPNRILFAAAEMGNTKFLVELIRQYPDLIWKVNDDNLSIFHIAVKHRHEGIYNLLYEIGSMKDLITPLKDQNGNTMLHLVGKSAKQKRLDDVSGVALQMQRELLWFQGTEEQKWFNSVRVIHPGTQRFGESWMKETANQCMVVAALIATIVFAAAFTVPGGYDQDKGLPLFRSKAVFMVFVVAVAISLLSSSASILMFLSILTSRYAECDFLESLPKKLMGGLVMDADPYRSTCCDAGPPIYQAANWFVDIIRSTYGSRYLFKPQKHVLYYENPKV
ncbi:ankyrin repeat-containing domain, PGG domain protein [Tanacetum coccineum]|uniref:Ankyrin repeat-containing domain, PGG domain protein n=1 Tax=Tanacetum coccineum TaxID=301880 RepID=A0ABQ4WJP2_9ASTR